jgi:CelD/BcsL family acetyltransferase involved in cellulose biosynthesis
MELELIQQFDTIEGMRHDWNQLLQSSSTNVPFLQFEYLKNWWKTLGGDEWKSGDLRIVIARDDLGELIGVAPLFKTTSSDNSHKYLFVGSIEISDYLDFIVAPENRTKFIYEVFEFLGEMDRSEWSSLDLYNIPDWSTDTDDLLDLSNRLGWTAGREKLQPCPMIALEGDWDSYLMGLKKKQRHELRRKLRNAEAYPEEVNFKILTKGDPLEESIDAYINLMSFDPRKAAFLNPKMESNIRDLIKIALAGDWLLLAFLEVGGEKIAANMNFDYHNRLWVYNSGFHPEYFDLSPGWVLLGKTTCEQILLVQDQQHHDLFRKTEIVMSAWEEGTEFREESACLMAMGSNPFSSSLRSQAR